MISNLKETEREIRARMYVDSSISDRNPTNHTLILLLLYMIIAIVRSTIMSAQSLLLPTQNQMVCYRFPSIFIFHIPYYNILQHPIQSKHIVSAPSLSSNIIYILYITGTRAMMLRIMKRR